jgi:signal transduction histidine kinase
MEHSVFSSDRQLNISSKTLTGSGKFLIKNGFPDSIAVSVGVDDEAKEIVADSTYLNRIFYNLITNAIQAMPKGGKLEITSYKEAYDMVTTVNDTGVGIPKDDSRK